ncbi:EmrB/QacA subfamily drug resistance transporter [Actinocorallia herbida]|uniref:EmrB/QacA subfamily drug resistance transporter n=1 Tax=Actinocorallia herbida TaxID=58109 RepID=A0A3N1CQJ9_9ACTN|nr:MFS transporter [Actinocorallia herbida]ROO83573.1 EmrB/QacA subfamily drug resistance transporter [Actinocorallia herbida]
MSAPSTADPRQEAAAPPGGKGRWLGLAVISLAVSLIVVDATIVSVLLPSVVDEIGLRATQAEWLTSIYSLVFAALMITFGRLSDVYGRRLMFVLGTLVFVVASLAVAASGSATELIGARALQGVGAAMIMPATLSTVNSLFHGRDRAIAFGVWGSMIGGMTAVGPLLGGWLATSHGWQWAFTINLPLGALLIAGVLKYVPETRDASGPRGIDWKGGVLSALGLGALVFGLIEGQTYGWWQASGELPGWPISPVPLALGAAVLLLVTFVLVERARARAGRPVMLDLRLFRIANFRRGNAAASLISVGELGLLFILPLFLQGAHGDSPLQICVAILPLAIGSFLSGGTAARLGRRVGAARVVQYGMAMEFAAVLAIGLTTHAGTTGYGLAPWMLLYGLGLGMTSAQLTNISLADVPRGQSGQASGTQSTSRQVGSALGIACIGTVFATSLGHAMQARTGDAEAAAALQGSVGTGISALDPEQARAAIESLATATGHAALVTAGILAVGLIMTLRLRGKEL